MNTLISEETLISKFKDQLFVEHCLDRFNDGIIEADIEFYKAESEECGYNFYYEIVNYEPNETYAERYKFAVERVKKLVAADSDPINATGFVGGKFYDAT